MRTARTLLAEYRDRGRRDNYMNVTFRCSCCHGVVYRSAFGNYAGQRYSWVYAQDEFKKHCCKKAE